MPGGFANLPISQITNVQFGGAVVITAIRDGIDGRRYRGTGGADQTWKFVDSVGGIAFYSISYGLAGKSESSQATPTFLVGGLTDQGAEIHRSKDGKTWSVVLQATRFGGFGNITGIVWNPDENSFYAAGIFELSPAGTEGFAGRMYQSSNGQSWDMTEEWTAGTDTAGIVAAEEAMEAAFKAHCPETENEGAFPDGVIGYSSVSETLVKPAALDKWTVNGITQTDSLGPPGSVKIIDADGTRLVGLPITRVYGVSYAGGVWNAAGIDDEMVIFTSTDRGETWHEVYRHTFGIISGIVSSAKKDVVEPESEAT